MVFERVPFISAILGYGFVAPCVRKNASPKRRRGRQRKRGGKWGGGGTVVKELRRLSVVRMQRPEICIGTDCDANRVEFCSSLLKQVRGFAVDMQVCCGSV